MIKILNKGFQNHKPGGGFRCWKTKGFKDILSTVYLYIVVNNYLIAHYKKVYVWCFFFVGGGFVFLFFSNYGSVQTL